MFTLSDTVPIQTECRQPSRFLAISDGTLPHRLFSRRNTEVSALTATREVKPGRSATLATREEEHALVARLAPVADVHEPEVAPVDEPLEHV